MADNTQSYSKPTRIKKVLATQEERARVAANLDVLHESVDHVIRATTTLSFADGGFVERSLERVSFILRDAMAKLGVA